jgi:hypothetical protein
VYEWLCFKTAWLLLLLLLLLVLLLLWHVPLTCCRQIMLLGKGL